MELFDDNDIDEFAEEIKSQLIEENLDHIEISITYVNNPTLFIEKGFFPMFDDQEKKLALEAYLSGDYTPEEYDFWFNDLNLPFHPDWVYATINYWEDLGQKTAYSLPLLLYAPDKVYKKSGRPKTDMSLFRNPDLTIQKFPKKYRIPVTRYSEGMSKGLYYKSEKYDFCGTFYYYEIESDVLLGFDSFLKFPNKWESLKYFYNSTDVIPESNKSEYEEILKYGEGYIYEYLHKYGDYWTGNGLLPKDLMMAPKEFSEKFKHLSKFSEKGIEKLHQNKRYIGWFSELYGAEDWLDQDLCKWSKKLGIEVIILENMIGSHQIVTEILDSRPREESFNNLVYPS